MTGRDLKKKMCLEALHKGRRAMARIIALSIIMDEQRELKGKSNTMVSPDGLLYQQ